MEGGGGTDSRRSATGVTKKNKKKNSSGGASSGRSAAGAKIKIKNEHKYKTIVGEVQKERLFFLGGMGANRRGDHRQLL